MRAKERVRSTGERYAVARAQILAARPDQPRAEAPITLPLFPSVHAVGGQQADVAAARNLLANAGVVGHDGAPLTEAMAFGLAGGVGFLYGVFEYEGTPTMTIVGRNSSTPDSFLEPLFERAGAKVRISTTGSAAKGRRELDALLDEETPAICTVGAGWLDYLGLPRDESAMSPHVVGVIGRTDGTLLLDDRAPQALSVDADTFAAARAAYRPAKHRVISVTAVPGEHDWVGAVNTALRAGVRGYDTPPVPQFAANVGMAGLKKWHRLLTRPSEKKSWHRIFADGSRAAIGLTRLYDCVTHAYTAPGAGRFLYADFLEEAAGILGGERTSEAASAFRRSGELWSRLATTAIAASDDLTRYAELADLRSAQLDGQPVAEQMAMLHAEQRDLVANCDLTPVEAADVFGRLGEVLAEIIEVEQQALGSLRDD